MSVHVASQVMRSVSTPRVNWRRVSTVSVGSRPEAVRQAQSLPVDARAVGDSDDVDDEKLVLDRVDDAMLALADPVSILAGQLLTSRRTRILGEGVDSVYNPLANALLRDCLDLTDSRWLDLEAISCHCASAT